MSMVQFLSNSIVGAVVMFLVGVVMMLAWLKRR